MNNEQIYSIISQGLDVANKKGCFSLEESHHVGNALIGLQKALFPNGMPKEPTKENATKKLPTKRNQVKVKSINQNGTNKGK